MKHGMESGISSTHNCSNCLRNHGAEGRKIPSTYCNDISHLQCNIRNIHVIGNEARPRPVVIPQRGRAIT
ncbi:protein kinase [Sesbania bispinosa]|nr:protein kinase [Sesbania bispinosa]